MKKIISLVCAIAIFCTFLTVNFSANALGHNQAFGEASSITNWHTDPGADLFVAQIKYINGDPYPYNSMPYDETLYMVAFSDTHNVRLLDLDTHSEQKDQIRIAEYLTNKTGRYFENYKNIVILGDIVYIGNESFELNTRLENIYIPDSVTEMGKNIFCEQSNPVIHCSNGSAAMKYALENNHAFDAKDYRGINGDVNCDNSINMKDVLALRKYIVGRRTAIEVNSTDINGDNSVNMKDVLKIRKMIVGIE